MVIHTCKYIQSANSEVHSTNDEILILVSTNIPIVLSPVFPVLLKTPIKTQIPSTNMTYIQHQIDRLRQKMEKATAENNEFKNLIKKNAEERIYKTDEAEILYEKNTNLEKKNNVLKTRLKTNKQ